MCWHKIVRRPVTLASMRSRHTGQVGNSRKAGVGGGAGRVGSEGDNVVGGRNGSSINGKIVSRWVVDEDWKVTLFTNTT